MEKILNKIAKISSLASRYIGIIIIAFSCVAFFWRDGFAWMTNYTSVFLGVIMFGMGLTIKMEDFRIVFSRPKEVVIGAVAQYTIMPVVAWILCKVMNLPADLALGVILVGCCPGGTASNVITYIAGGDVALSVGMTIVSTLAAPLATPFLVYVLAGAWVEVSFWAMVLSVIKVILVPVLLGIILRSLAGEHVDKVSDVMPLISVIAIAMIIGGIVAVNADKILNCGVLVLGVVAIHNFCGMMLGLLAAKIFHVDYSRTTAIAIEVGMQNSGLAVSLAAANFAANPLATLPGAIFSVWQISQVPYSPESAVLAYMMGNCSTVTLNELAEEFHFSVPYCSKLIKSISGKNFSNLLTEIRLQHGEQLLLSSQLSVEDISDRVGYKNPESFIRAFRRLYNDTPSQYRRKNK